MLREIVLDTETTGLYVHEGHRVTEVAAIELIDGTPSGKSFHSYLNPERDVPEKVLNGSGEWVKHPSGLTNELLSDKPLFAAIARELKDFIGNSSIVITCRTNPDGYTLDVAFLNMEMENAGLPPFRDDQWINVRRWSEIMFGDSRASLDTVLDHYKVDRSERDRHGHGALLDAQLLAEAYPKLLNDYMRFAKKKVPNLNSKISPPTP